MSLRPQDQGEIMNEFWNTPAETLTTDAKSSEAPAVETTNPQRLFRMMKLLEEFKGFVRDAIDEECDGTLDDLAFLELCAEVFHANYPLDEEAREL
jgi:hypothetical protein